MQIDGAILRRLRDENALTLRELGETASVSWVTIWRIEHGKTKDVRALTARKLAKALGVKPRDLLTALNGKDFHDTD